LAAFAVAAGVITMLAFGAALSVSAAKGGLARRLEGQAPTMKHWGGAVLVVVGAWFLVTAAFSGPISRWLG